MAHLEKPLLLKPLAKLSKAVESVAREVEATVPLPQGIIQGADIARKATARE